MTAEQIKRLEELGFVSLPVGWQKEYSGDWFGGYACVTVRKSGRVTTIFCNESKEARHDLEELRKVGIE